MESVPGRFAVLCHPTSISIPPFLASKIVGRTASTFPPHASTFPFGDITALALPPSVVTRASVSPPPYFLQSRFSTPSSASSETTWRTLGATPEPYTPPDSSSAKSLIFAEYSPSPSSTTSKMYISRDSAQSDWGALLHQELVCRGGMARQDGQWNDVADDGESETVVAI